MVDVSRKSIIDLELDLYLRKPMKCRFQRYIVRTEILSTLFTHESNTFMSLTCKNAIQTSGGRNGEIPKTALPLEACGPHFQRQTTARSVHPFPHTMQKSPHWLQWNAPNLPLKLPLPFDDHHPHLIHPSLIRPHLPFQTASGPNQPFCHNTLSGHTYTDRHTDEQMG